MTAGRRVKLRPGLTSEILDLVLDLGFWGSDREGKRQDILTADSEKKHREHSIQIILLPVLYHG